VADSSRARPPRADEARGSALPTRRSWPSGATRSIVAAVGPLAALAGLTILLSLRPRDDVPRDPDAVVVLGGAGHERLELGIELGKRYNAALVLSSSAIAYGRRRGLVCGTDVLCLVPEPETTTGEARTVAELADVHGWHHVTVATSRFHSSRARVLFRQCLGDRVTVVGARAPDGQARDAATHLREALGTMAALTVRPACAQGRSLVLRRSHRRAP
jgi:uncharacterized SAM-binding protein YcdF (DUF218 family)